MMKILLTGLRGVGKSTVGKLAAGKTNSLLFCISDLLKQQFSGFNGSSFELRMMLGNLSTLERAQVYAKTIEAVNSLENLFLEMPLVEKGDFDTMVPIDPVVRMVHFDALVMLEAEPCLIRKRRDSREQNRTSPKVQNPLYLRELEESIGAHQNLCRMMLIGLGTALARPTFVIRNEGEALATAMAIVAAMDEARQELEFAGTLTRILG